MSKFLAGLLAFAVLVWGAANAPGWSAGRKLKGADAHPAESAPQTLPAYDPVMLAALGHTGEFDIDAWMERAQEEMNARWAAWNQFNSAKDYSYVAPERYSGFGRHGGGASGDVLLADSNVRFSGSGFDPAVSGSIAGIIPGFRGIPAGPASGGQGGKGHTPNGNGPGTDPGTPNEHPSGGTDNEHPPGTNPPETNPPGTNPPDKDPPETHPPGTHPENPDPWGPGKPGDGPDIPETPTVTVPEPGSIGLLGLGLVGLGLFRRRLAAR